MSELAATTPTSPSEIASLCSNPLETWFPQFGCQPSSLLAIADYTRGDYNLYVRSGSTIFTAVPPISTGSFTPVQSTDYFANGARINTGQYIDYNVASIT